VNRYLVHHWRERVPKSSWPVQEDRRKFLKDILSILWRARRFILADGQNAISRALNWFKNIIILSSSKWSWDEVLYLYRERDEVEKKFDDLKNELEVMPPRVQNVETLHGLLFIFFISLILRAILLLWVWEAKLLDKISQLFSHPVEPLFSFRYFMNHNVR